MDRRVVMEPSVAICDRCGLRIRGGFGEAGGFYVSVRSAGSGSFSVCQAVLCEVCFVGMSTYLEGAGVKMVRQRDETIGEMIDRVIRQCACERVEAGV